MEFFMEDGVLVHAFGADEMVRVPDTVKEIGPGAFAENCYIRHVRVPSSVKKIRAGAFTGCAELCSVSITEPIDLWENGIFRNCPNLMQVRVRNPKFAVRIPIDQNRFHDAVLVQLCCLLTDQDIPMRDGVLLGRMHDGMTKLGTAVYLSLCWKEAECSRAYLRMHAKAFQKFMAYGCVQLGCAWKE